MAEGFKKGTRKEARKWPLDCAEALTLGLDGSTLAGTGAGKTAVYMLPLFLPGNGDKMLVVVSPLKAHGRPAVSTELVR